MDMSILPNDGIHKLSFFISDGFKTRDGAELPDSIRDIFIGSRCSKQLLQESIDTFIYSLPRNLHRLSIPQDYRFTQQCILPPTLEDLEYECTRDSLDHLVVPVNRHYKSCKLQSQSIEDTEWLNTKPWISALEVKAGSVSHNLSNHIKQLRVWSWGFDFEDVVLPESLELIHCYTAVPTKKGQLPSSLKNFYHSFFKQPFESGLFPESIETLNISFIIKEPMPHGFLPSSNLKHLELWYNQELQVGILPQTLEYLSIHSYQKPLKPYVLPNGLKTFIAESFDGQLDQHSLPTSLTSLNLRSFRGSYSSIGPLNKLSFLSIFVLNQSVLTLISNIKQIDIEFLSINETTLQNTVIERLNLKCKVQQVTLPPSFFPQSLRHLDMYNTYIESSNVLNDGCVSIISNKPIDDSFIPPSVIKLNNKKRNNN